MTVALIFDLGKVVFDYSWEKTFTRWAEASGLSVAQVAGSFEFGETFAKFERDEISADEFRMFVSSRAGYDFTAEEFESGWNNIYLDVFPGVNELLAALRKKYRIAALSNTNRLHEKRWRVQFASTLSHFEKIFASHDLRSRKPEEKCYRAVLDYLGAAPHETIFLDDVELNVRAAERLGMKTVHVVSPAQMMQTLKELKVSW